MADEQLRLRRASIAALACGALNAAALAAMVAFLRPGLPPTPPLERILYLREHAPTWRACWGLWVVTAAALVVCCLTVRHALNSGGRGRVALALTIAGMVADFVGHGLYLGVYPTVHDEASLLRLDRTAALVSGGLANGPYTAAWLLLAWKAPLPRPFLLLSVPGIVGGGVLTISGVATWTPGLVAGTALAIPCFALWSLGVGLFFWKKARAVVTMASHA